MRNAEGGTKETEKGGKLVSVDATPENEKVTETVKEEKERLIREDIKTMKRIINPISKI